MENMHEDGNGLHVGKGPLPVIEASVLGQTVACLLGLLFLACLDHSGGLCWAKIWAPQIGAHLGLGPRKTNHDMNKVKYDEQIQKINNNKSRNDKK